MESDMAPHMLKQESTQKKNNFHLAGVVPVARDAAPVPAAGAGSVGYLSHLETDLRFCHYAALLRLRAARCALRFRIRSARGAHACRFSTTAPTFGARFSCSSRNRFHENATCTPARRRTARPRTGFAAL